MDKFEKSRTYVVMWLMTVVAALCPGMAGAAVTHTQSFSTSDISVEVFTAPDGTRFSRLHGDKMYVEGNPGSPGLPVKVIRFLVPDDACDFSVSVTSASAPVAIGLEHPLFPVQEAIPINDYDDSKFTYADRQAYIAHASTYNVGILNESRLEGKHHIVAVAVCPFSYTGSSNSLTLCESMEISLDFSENPSGRQKKSSAKKGGIIDVSSFVVNPEPASSGIRRTLEENPNGSDLPTRYYIISERSLIPALEDLAAWKTQKGYTVVTKAIEDIYEDPRYSVDPATEIVDEAASLRKYLQDEFETYDTFFCLLVGDHRTRMPIRKVTRDRAYSLPNTNGDNYIPTDNYFSDLSDDWNIFKDNNGLYVDKYNNNSYEPYIYVGRLLCHTEEEISNYTSKLILYESHPGRGNAEYLDKSLLTVQYDGKDEYYDTLTKMQAMFNSVECLLDIKISDDSKRGYPSGEMMLQSINENGYCSLMGHGEPSTVACSGIHGKGKEWEYIKALDSYKNKDVANPNAEYQTNIINNPQNNGLDLMTNFDKPSVIYSLSCTSTPFDVYDSGELIFDVPHTVASSYTVGGLYGGVAYLGNTRSGYWGPSSDLERLFLDALIEYPNIGIAEAISKYSFYYNLITNAHNLIGDPELEMWRSAPSQIEADLIYNDDNICISGGFDLLGARYVLNDGSGNFSVMTQDKPISYTFSYPDNDRMVAVSVFKTGYLPIVTLRCESQKVTGCAKKFVVRDAALGMSDAGVSGDVEIGTDAEVSIRAVDSVSCGKGVSVKGNGTLDINCDRDVSLTGCALSGTAKLTANAEKITISNGFTVKKGAKLVVNKK